MSYKNSNLYASRVFAEHPLALWSIDENFYFSSLISASAKQINEIDWDVLNGSIATGFTSPSQNPIEGAEVSKVYLSSSSEFIMEISGEYISYENKIDKEKSTICLNFYAYIPNTSNIYSIEYGFYIGGQYFLDSRSLTLFDYNKWVKFEYTKELLSEEDIKPIIKVSYNEDAINNEPNSSFFISGLSIGQWSESYNSQDTGVVVESIPANIKNLISVDYSSLINGVQVDPYGFNDQDLAYVIEFNKKLLAETSGLPMVYGSKNNVSILPRNSENYVSASVSIPSLVFPGKGFLNQSGKYSNITVEFWTRINNESTVPVRIFGPLSSDDGIYVDGDLITLRVGKYVKSYFIGQWYRPMLLHFGQALNEIFLMINGEKVISINIESLDIDTFPDSTEDLVGFYGNENILPFDLDCFSIFPYTVTEQIAKLRFAYGQGVEDQEIISTTFGGDLTYVSFPFAGYSSTISFPDRTPWSNGYFNNLKVNSNGISLPDYTLPDLLFTENTGSVSIGESELIWQGFEEDNYAIQDEEYPFVSLRPNSNYNNVNSTILFSKINKTSYPTKSIWSLLKLSDDIDTEQSILFITNKNTTDIMEARIVSGSLQYLYNNEILDSQTVSQGNFFTAGFDIDKISETYSQTRSFLSNGDLLSLNFAGSGSNVFLGKIFSLSINNQFFTQKDTQLFDNNGFSQIIEGAFDYIGSYTLLPKQSNSTIFFDIAATGYWETSVPMSYFGKYITNSNGLRVYDLDLIQFNIDVPTTQYSKENQKSLSYQEYTKAKTYMTIQSSGNVGTIPYTSYTNTEVVGNDRVLDFNVVQNTESTKFEVVDSTVIFPPKDIGNFADYYLTTHILLTSHGIMTENIRVKNMAFSSAAFDESSFYRINTPTGRSIYPITKSNDQYVYKRKNPVIIEKEVGSYFYNTGNSGIQVAPYEDGMLVKGLSFPINENMKSDFKLVGIQMYLMFNELDTFTEEKIFAKILSSKKEYDLVIEPELGGKRGKIKIVDSKTKDLISGVTTFLNGKVVSNIIVRPLRWNSIIISLQDNNIDLNQEMAQLEVYSGVRVNNVIAISDINEIRTNLRITNDWGDIDNEIWNYYASSTWLEVLDEENIPVTILSVDGADIFNTYSGLSSAIGDDSAILDVSFDSIVVLNDTIWTTFEDKPI